ncbi:MAG: outer membrane lipoprotein-sorting protein [Planctomycetota bacterium]
MIVLTSALALATVLAAMPQLPPSQRPQSRPQPRNNPAVKNSPDPRSKKTGRETKRGMEKPGEETESPGNAPAAADKAPEAAKDSSGVPIPPVPDFDRSDPEVFGRQLIEYLQTFEAGWANELGHGKIFHEGTGESAWYAPFRWLALERPDRGDQRLLRVMGEETGPSGGLLIHAKPRFPAKAWIHEAPAEAADRLSSDELSRTLLGSALQARDLAPIEINRFEWKYLGDESIARDGEQVYCYRLEQRTDREGEPTRILWIAHQWRIERIETLSEEGATTRTIDFAQWAHHEGRFWRPWRWALHDRASKSKTMIAFSDLDLLDDSAAAPEWRDLKASELLD